MLIVFGRRGAGVACATIPARYCHGASFGFAGPKAPHGPWKISFFEKSWLTMITLTGMTWNHTRGLLPLVATAQRFSELHPNVTIEWHRRSLQEFADSPIEQLAERFALLIIDHPFAGYAATHPTLLALDELLPT